MVNMYILTRRNRHNISLGVCAIIFTGSVFLTSGKFVNETNGPKYYFVLLSLLLLALFFAISGKTIKLNSLSNAKLQWAIYLVCIAQAMYGLFQFAGWFPSNHRHFAITGSFDNPAGFAVVLATGFPLGFYLLQKRQRWKQYLFVTCQAVIFMAITFSGSRAGIVAIVSSGLVFLCLTFPTRLSHFLRNRKWLLLLFMVLSIAGSSLLYLQKKDSANGRLLIWQVSWVMIKNKPVMGHGYGSFQTKYMNYQAEYFRRNPDSEHALLADNVNHPFNEFLKIAVEFGVAGIVLVISLIFGLFYKGLKKKNEISPIAFSGLTALFVFACFSYPFQYAISWLVLAFYLSALLPAKEYELAHSKAVFVVRVFLACICLMGVFIAYKQIRAEINCNKFIKRAN